MSGTKIKNTLKSKDVIGGAGAGVGAGIFIVWGPDIHVLMHALWQHWGLDGDALVSATKISTDSVIILGTAFCSWIASFFTKHEEVKASENNNS